MLRFPLTSHTARLESPCSIWFQAKSHVSGTSWVFVPLPQTLRFICWNLISNVAVLEVELLRTDQCPYKGDFRELLSPFATCEDTARGRLSGSRFTPDTESAYALILVFPPFRTVRSECALFKAPIGGVSGMGPKQTEAVSQQWVLPRVSRRTSPRSRRFCPFQRQGQYQRRVHTQGRTPQHACLIRLMTQHRDDDSELVEKSLSHITSQLYHLESPKSSSSK